MDNYEASCVNKMVFLNLLLFSVASIVLYLSCVIFVECFSAFWHRPQKPSRMINKRDVAVLMPAHNESAIIANTLQALQPHLQPTDCVIVVADNCTDNTAQIARQFDVTVIERYSATERGKGYALDFGMAHLRQSPPQVVVILDADCILADGCLAQIVQQADQLNRPVQATYLLHSPEHPTPKDQISAFAFQVKNLVRPLGLHSWKQPCLLTGTGMAFPWELLSQVSLASSNIVEDMQLGVDLALAGYAPQLAPNAFVYGGLPKDDAAATSQRTRWEHGHVQTLMTQVPRLLKGAVRQFRLDLLALAVELSVPPLALLVLGWLATLFLTIVAAIFGASWLPAGLAGLSGLLIFAGIGLAWLRFSREILPLQTLLRVPAYILWKIPLYLKLITQPQQTWVRTKRDEE